MSRKVHVVCFGTLGNPGRRCGLRRVFRAHLISLEPVMRTPPNLRNALTTPATGLLALAVVGLLWSYWTTLCVLASRWAIDPQYSHGFLVPLVAAGLIWMRRERLGTETLRGSWLGIPLIVVGIAMRLAAARFYFEWFDWLSILPTVAGLCLLIGGLPAWRCAWPALLFLAFMIPLPYRLETMLGGPLQSVATLASTLALQTLGFPAIAHGNIIEIGDSTVGVAEACSGLRMLVVFFAVATAVAIVVQKPVWEKLLLVGSAVPIAVFCNVLRITVTGVLFETVGSAWARIVFHDLAGWLMMVLALGLLKLEMWLLDHILIDPPARDVVPVLAGRQGQAHVANDLPLRASPDNRHETHVAEKELVTV